MSSVAVRQGERPREEEQRRSSDEEVGSTCRGPHDEDQHSSPEDEPRTYSRGYVAACLIGYSLGSFVFGCQIGVLGPTVGGLAARLHIQEADLNPLFTASGVAFIVSGAPSGWLVDRAPTHRVLVGSLVIQAVGFALVPSMPSVWSLTLLYAAACFSFNFTNSAVLSSIAWIFPTRPGPAFNLVSAIFGLGSFIIPLAAQACEVLFGSILTVYYVIGALALASTAPSLYVSSPSRPAAPAAAPAGGGGGGGGEAGGGDARRRAGRSLVMVVAVGALALMFFIYVGETALGNWIFTFCVKEAGCSDKDAAASNSVYWGLFTLGRVIGAVISHAMTPLALLLGSLPFSIVGAALPLVVGRANLTRAIVMAMAALTGGWGLGTAMGYANAVSLLGLYVPVTGLITGLFGMAVGAGVTVGPVLVAVLAKGTALRYMALPWVTLVADALQLPAILTAVVAGRKLLTLRLLLLPRREAQSEMVVSPAGASTAAEAAAEAAKTGEGVAGAAAEAPPGGDAAEAPAGPETAEPAAAVAGASEVVEATVTPPTRAGMAEAVEAGQANAGAAAGQQRDDTV